MRRLALALVLFLVPGLMPARAEQRWTLATSANFELLTTAGEKRAREAILRFEQVRSFFLKASGARPPAKGRVQIVAFASDKEYLPYRANEGAAGHAGGGRDQDQIVMRGISAEQFPIAVHEYVHILFKPWEKIPLWLNEGVSDLYSTLTPIGKKVRVGDVPVGRAIELRQSKWLDLDTLIHVEHDSPIYNQKESQGIFYAESWALAHMLFFDAAYRDKFSGFVNSLATGTSTTEAFQQTYGKQLQGVSKDLRDYTDRGALVVAIFNVTLEKSAEEPEVRPAAPLESGLPLAGILADLNKLDEARTAYAALARDYPADARIPEALAYLAWRSHDTFEAQAQFAKAVELGSRNSRLYYDYAGLIEDARDRRAAQMALLRKAVELNPEYREARMQLAYLLLSAGDYKGTLAEFTRIGRVDPKDAFQFFYSVAYANFQLGKKEEALLFAKRAGERADTPTQRNTIQELLNAMLDRPAEDSELAPAAADRPEPADESKPVRARILRRRGTPISGTLARIDCLTGAARVHLRTGSGLIQLLIDNPDSIEIRGAEDGHFTFECGPQRPRRVTIEYEPAANGKLGTAGVVRMIEFQP